MVRPEKRVALVIGNAIYHHGDTLKNPVNDARAISDALNRLNFAGAEPQLDVNYNQLRRALQDFSVKADGADMAVIYFAGHGVEVDGRNFLIPVDAKLERSRDVDFEAISLDQTLNAVDGARQLRLIILDACRNNPFRARMLHAGGTRSVGHGLRSIEPGGNVLVAYAAKHGTFALDGKGGNSPYAEALLNHIEEPGVEIGQLFREVRDDVLERTGNSQEPHLYGSLGRQQIFLKPVEAAPPRGDLGLDAKSLYDEIRIDECENPELIKAFIAQFEVSAPLMTWRARRRLNDIMGTSEGAETLSESYSAIVEVEIGERGKTETRSFLAGAGKTEWFKDIEYSPEMIVIPPGQSASFGNHRIVSQPNKNNSIRITQPLAVGRFPVTVDEFARFVHMTKRKIPNALWTYEGILRRHWELRSNRSFQTPGFRQSGCHPVIGINWNDAQAYASWLSDVTGHPYRLLTQDEWWYAVGQWTERTIQHTNEWAEVDVVDGTLPVANFESGPWGIHKQSGRIWEWCADTWVGDTDRLSEQASRFMLGVRLLRDLRGGVLNVFPENLRAACQKWETASYRVSICGLRVARALN